MPGDIATLYLDLLKRTLTRYDLGDNRYPVRSRNAALSRILGLMTAGLHQIGLELDRVRPFDPAIRGEGRTSPTRRRRWWAPSDSTTSRCVSPL